MAARVVSMAISVTIAVAMTMIVVPTTPVVIMVATIVGAMVMVAMSIIGGGRAEVPAMTRMCTGRQHDATCQCQQTRQTSDQQQSPDRSGGISGECHERMHGQTSPLAVVDLSPVSARKLNCN